MYFNSRLMKYLVFTIYRFTIYNFINHNPKSGFPSGRVASNINFTLIHPITHLLIHIHPRIACVIFSLPMLRNGKIAINTLIIKTRIIWL